MPTDESQSLVSRIPCATNAGTSFESPRPWLEEDRCIGGLGWNIWMTYWPGPNHLILLADSDKVLDALRSAPFHFRLETRGVTGELFEYSSGTVGLLWTW